MCGFNDIFQLINNIIKFFLTTILLPIVVLLIAYSGFLFMTSAGNDEKRTKAKGIFKHIVVGILMILGAWFIVYTVFRAFGYDTSRGKAGLSDSTVNWGGSNLNINIDNSKLLATSSTAGDTAGKTKVQTYTASFVSNTVVPKNTRVTVSINPKAASSMPVLLSCLSTDGNTKVDTQGKIPSGSSTVGLALALFYDTEYKCIIENTENTLTGEFTIQTPVDPAKPKDKKEADPVLNDKTVLPTGPDESSKTINTIFSVTNIKPVLKTTGEPKVVTSANMVMNFNGSIDVAPNMDLVCSSSFVNHIYRSGVVYDATASKKNSLITIPVAWSGTGLRPSSVYLCQLNGSTLKNVSGYKEQRIKNVYTAFNISTPAIPPLKKFESKLFRPVVIGYPRVWYKNYQQPVLQPGQIPVFKQPIPDSILVPVINGSMVDGGSMDLNCNQIMGPSKASWLKKVSLDNKTESSFSIEISKNPATGFMHSSVYSCTVDFFVERLRQIRGFTVSTPVYIEAKEVGPIELYTTNITPTKDYVFFNVVASHRIESSVNYICRNSTGNYSGNVSWMPQGLGVRVPVAIQVSDTIPGLKTKSLYDCEITGSTYQKDPVMHKFTIKTL
jgi:hypothetical protein